MQILEYERPRLIPGRFRGVTATEPAPRGMEWGQMYPISDEQARYLQTQVSFEIHSFRSPMCLSRGASTLRGA